MKRLEDMTHRELVEELETRGADFNYQDSEKELRRDLDFARSWDVGEEQR